MKIYKRIQIPLLAGFFILIGSLSCTKETYQATSTNIAIPFQKEDIEFFDRRQQIADKNRFLKKREGIAYIEPPLTIELMNSIDEQIKGYMKEDGAPLKVNYYVEFAYQSYSGYVKDKPYSTGVQIRIELINNQTGDAVTTCTTTLLSEEDTKKSNYKKALQEAYENVTRECFRKMEKELKRALKFT
ncbi:MAG: hypothetical protein AAF363_15225 [Bacteroidota bacterium]